MTDKKFTIEDYNNYMHVLSYTIDETERRMNNLNKSKKILKLSFEDWVKFQNGSLKVDDISYF